MKIKIKLWFLAAIAALYVTMSVTSVGLSTTQCIDYNF